MLEVHLLFDLETPLDFRPFFLLFLPFSPFLFLSPCRSLALSLCLLFFHSLTFRPLTIFPLSPSLLFSLSPRQSFDPSSCVNLRYLRKHLLLNIFLRKSASSARNSSIKFYLLEALLLVSLILNQFSVSLREVLPSKPVIFLQLTIFTPSFSRSIFPS